MYGVATNMAKNWTDPRILEEGGGVRAGPQDFQTDKQNNSEGVRPPKPPLREHRFRETTRSIVVLSPCHEHLVNMTLRMLVWEEVQRHILSSSQFLHFFLSVCVARRRLSHHVFFYYKTNRIQSSAFNDLFCKSQIHFSPILPCRRSRPRRKYS